jgi:lipopolysaccharide transport system permease protein
LTAHHHQFYVEDTKTMSSSEITRSLGDTPPTNSDETNFDLIIKPGQGLANYWQEAWSYRELFFFLAWRDILVRYKQTVIGIVWAVIRPILTMVVFTIVFGKIANLPSDGIPYPVLVFSASLPWQFFANALQESSSSMVSNSSMIAKIYFPRLVIPASTVVTGLVDFLISCGILVVIMAAYQFYPTWRIALLPFFLLLAIGTALGAGLWFAALNVTYRDFRYVVPFLIQFGLYISPVGFSSSVIPDQWRWLYSLNPMVGVIDGFRWAISGQDLSFYWPGFIFSIVLTITLFLSGTWFFRKTERTFADVI